MPRSKDDLRLLQSLRDALATVRIGGPAALSWVMPELLEHTSARGTIAYGLRIGEATPALAFSHHAGELPVDLDARLQSVWSRPGYQWTYDPSRPSEAERNRVVTVDEQLAGPSRETVVRAMEAHLEAGLDLSGQMRVLICDGPSLLAMVALYRDRFGERDARLLAALSEPLQQRLRLERQLAQGTLAEASLAAALEAVGAPAFILGPRGAVAHANSAGRALLEHDGRAREALAEVAAGRSAALQFEVVAVSAPGLPFHHLAVMKDASIDPAPRAKWLAGRWSLTPRQTAVLLALSRGLSNKTIASSLACTERTVEQHLRALFAKTGAESRAALVALFWTSR